MTIDAAAEAPEAPAYKPRYQLPHLIFCSKCQQLHDAPTGETPESERWTSHELKKMYAVPTHKTKAT